MTKESQKKLKPASVSRLIVRELRHRPGSFIAAVLVLALALALLLQGETRLQGFSLETASILDKQQQDSQAQLDSLANDIRKDMKKLGFNIYILPGKVDLLERIDGATKASMPEEYVQKLADFKGLTVINHLLPLVHRRSLWKEKNDLPVMIMGISSQVPIAHRGNSKKPIMKPVKDGQIILGHSLHSRYKIKVGEEISFNGIKYKVRECYKQRGTGDDVTVWIPLADAQKMFDMQGKISAIWALECNCASIDRLGEITEQIHKILPGVIVQEVTSTALARAKARNAVAKSNKIQMQNKIKERAQIEKGQQQNALWMSSIGLVLAGLLLAALAAANVHRRREECGVWLALGYGRAHLLKLFLGRALLSGLFAAIFAVLLHLLLLKVFYSAQFLQLVQWQTILSSLLAAPSLAIISAAFPCLRAAMQSPADILRSES